MKIHIEHLLQDSTVCHVLQYQQLLYGLPLSAISICKMKMIIINDTRASCVL